MPTETILLIDDDPDILRLLRGYLEQAGYKVHGAGTLKDSWQLLQTVSFDLLVLDLNLPDGDGWDMTRRVRATAKLADLPIVMLTARVEDTDKIVGLELGADDYITKPFNPREVVARIRALLRRLQRPVAAAQLLVAKDLVLNLTEHTVQNAGQPIALTPTEFNLLRAFMENPRHAFTRDELLEQGLGYAFAGAGRTLDSHIRNLRQKLHVNPNEPELIQTVFGIGYRFVAGVSKL